MLSVWLGCKPQFSTHKYAVSSKLNPMRKRNPTCDVSFLINPTREQIRMAKVELYLALVAISKTEESHESDAATMTALAFDKDIADTLSQAVSEIEKARALEKA